MQKLLVPVALLASIGILVVAVLFFHKNAPTQGMPLDAKNIPAVSETDHVMGSRTAPVTIIEYSDIDCPFCKLFEGNMKQIMAEYGPSGKVQWVWRHFPLTEIHPNTETHSEAAECAASLKTPETFFDFIAALHVAAPEEEKFDPKNYPAVVASLGINQKAFDECLTSRKFASLIAGERQQAMDAGASGTPFLVFIGPDGTKMPYGGALSHEQIKQMIDAVIGTSTPATATN